MCLQVAQIKRVQVVQIAHTVALATQMSIWDLLVRPTAQDTPWGPVGEVPETKRRKAGQLARPRTSMDALVEIEDDVLAATAEDQWLQQKKLQQKSKSLNSIISHLQLAMKNVLHENTDGSSAQQPAQRENPISGLIGLLIGRCDSHRANINEVKSILMQLANDEH